MTKQIFIFCLFATEALFAQTSHIPAIKSDWKITFDPVSPVYAKAEAHKILTVRLSNITSQTLWVFESNPLNDYRVSVTNVSGKLVPLTAQGRGVQERQQSTFFRTGIFRMPPGSKYDSLIDFEVLYALSPGKYIFHVTFVSRNQEVADSMSSPRKPGAIDPTDSVAFEITP